MYFKVITEFSKCVAASIMTKHSSLVITFIKIFIGSIFFYWLIKASFSMLQQHMRWIICFFGPMFIQNRWWIICLSWLNCPVGSNISIVKWVNRATIRVTITKASYACMYLYSSSQVNTSQQGDVTIYKTLRLCVTSNNIVSDAGHVFPQVHWILTTVKNRCLQN